MNPTDSTAPLTDDERGERDRLVGAARDALARILHHGAEFGRHVRELRDRRLYREDGLTWEAFVSATFGRSANWAYQYIEMADVCDGLKRAGVEELTVKSHARDVVQLPPDLRAGAVVRARELAEAEDAPLAARHLSTACDEVQDAGDADTATTVGGQDSAERVAVRTHEGLLVALPKGHAGPEATLATLPAYDVCPWTDAVAAGEWPETVRKPAFPSAELEEAAGHVWTVVVPGPWTAAETWEPAAGPSRAVYYPDRLRMAASRLQTKPEPTQKQRTVLVAPGVDLLGQAEPEGAFGRVLGEILEAAGRDRGRRYLVRTAYPERAAAVTWPPNVFVCVVAHRTAEAVAACHSALKDIAAQKALVVYDLAEPASPLSLWSFDWVLVRGARTTQDAYDSIVSALRPDQYHVGREVRARHNGYPPFDAAPSSRMDRPAARPPDDRGRSTSISTAVVPIR